MPPSRLIDNQETDGLLGTESPSKEADYSCWGRKRKKKRKSVQEEQVSHKRLYFLLCPCCNVLIKKYETTITAVIQRGQEVNIIQ